MSDQSFSNELERALARPDIAHLQRQARVYYEYYKAGFYDDSEQNHDDINAVLAAASDPDKALAYAILAAATCDDTAYLSFVAVDMLEENLLWDPSSEMLDRILTEGRKTPRVRWMLSAVQLCAIAERARRPVTEVVDGWTAENVPLPPRPFV